MAKLCSDYQDVPWRQKLYNVNWIMVLWFVYSVHQVTLLVRCMKDIGLDSVVPAHQITPLNVVCHAMFRFVMLKLLYRVLLHMKMYTKAINWEPTWFKSTLEVIKWHGLCPTEENKLNSPFLVRKASYGVTCLDHWWIFLTIYGTVDPTLACPSNRRYFWIRGTVLNPFRGQPRIFRENQSWPRPLASPVAAFTNMV